MEITNKQLIIDFIENIWNQQHFTKLNEFLHENYTDHSLPNVLPPNKEGIEKWITETGKAFEHKTFIEEIICEGNKIVVKIKMQMKHIGKWRGMEATLKQVHIAGYRYFEVDNNKIIAHWALVDGTELENQLKSMEHGCNIPHN